MKDSLLHSLTYVSRYYGLSNSPEALVNGLPLPEGKLTPLLLPRAAERAGLVAKEKNAPLEKVSELTLPAILLTGHDEACVLLSIDQEKGQAEIISKLRVHCNYNRAKRAQRRVQWSLLPD